MLFQNSTLPHGHESVVVTGNTKNPSRALILLHGRGASADNIMNLTDQLTLTNEYVVIAPQASEYTWYPNRFIVPQAENQPHLDSALARIKAIISYLADTHNIQTSAIVLVGFSQGACLAAEYIKRHPTRYQGVAVFSGGLIGTDDEVHEPVAGDLLLTPIYLGCDKEDFHIPKERVEQSAEIFTAMNAKTDLQLYENLGHGIHPEGIEALQKFITN